MLQTEKSQVFLNIDLYAVIGSGTGIFIGVSITSAVINIGPFDRIFKMFIKQSYRNGLIRTRIKLLSHIGILDVSRFQAGVSHYIAEQIEIVINRAGTLPKFGTIYRQAIG